MYTYNVGGFSNRFEYSSVGHNKLWSFAFKFLKLGMFAISENLFSSQGKTFVAVFRKRLVFKFNFK